MIFRIRMCLVMLAIKVYRLQGFFLLPRWFQFLFDAIDPLGVGLRQAFTNHFRWPQHIDYAYLNRREERFAKESDGHWYVYRSPPRFQQ